MTLFRDKLAAYMAERHPQLRASLRDKKIDDETGERIKAHIAHFKEEFLLEHPNRGQATNVEELAEDVASDSAEPSSGKTRG